MYNVHNIMVMLGKKLDCEKKKVYKYDSFITQPLDKEYYTQNS